MNKTIVLVGNPNVGKSVIFNRLTGRYAVVSNYPGTTVDLSRGVVILSGRSFQVIDTPGTNSLVPVSEDEQVTRDVLFRENPDIIVQVADEKNLKRTLFLTLELAELDVPMALALNMSDEALERGIEIDRVQLEKILGIPVVETVGLTGEGVGELKKQIINARRSRLKIEYRAEMEGLIKEVEELLPAGTAFKRALASMIISEDKSALKYLPESAAVDFRSGIAKKLCSFGGNAKLVIFNRRNGRIDEIISLVASVVREEKVSWLSKLGQMSMLPFPGYLIVFFVLFLMYEFVGVFAAGTMVNFFEHELFAKIINPLVTSLADKTIKYAFLRDFLVGEYGLITVAVTYALAIVFPIVSAFFLFFGILEDSGYLPRLSVMLDRIFRKFGLNGKAVLPMVLGLGCGTMAALSSRILETRKERLLVILLLSLTIPCSAQLGVILGIISGLSWKVTALWFVSIIGSLLLVGGIADRILPGVQSPFVLEIPPLRQPAISNILTKIKMRLIWYLKEAVPLFMLGTAILFFLDKLKILGIIETLIKPIASNLLGLPKEIAKVFIIGFLRRDYGAAGLYMLAKNGILTPEQILVSIVTMTLFVPCIAQCFMVIREQGWKTASLIFVFVSVYAVLFGGLVHFVVSALGIL